MKKNDLMIVALSGAAMTATSCALPKQEINKRPNIIWIFADDHSYQAIGAYGKRFAPLNPTPNIDKLAEEGMRFDRCYVGNSICAPSRATLLTGKHSHLHGKTRNIGAFNHNQQTFPGLLQRAGYQTAMIGKIHLDGELQGFNYWDVLPGQGKYNNPDFITDGKRTETKGYVTDIITDKALDWLKTKRDQDKPFMLMIHHKAPHRCWIPADKDMARYEDIDLPEPDNLFDDYKTRGIAAREQRLDIMNSMFLKRDLKIDGNTKGKYGQRNKCYQKNKPTGKDLLRFKYQQYMKDYLRCIWSVDENIGRVLEYLKKSGLADNTIVMYSSDQGFYNGEHGWFDKRFMYEESFRTPLLVRWPKVTKPGSVNKDLVQNIDWAETFLDIAGAEIPSDMQGKSLVPLLQGKTPEDWRESLYYHYYEYPKHHHVRPHEGVVTERFKLIRFYGDDVPNGEEWEFYDLEKDPHEMNNSYANPNNTEKIKEMKTELARLKNFYQVP